MPDLPEKPDLRLVREKTAKEQKPRPARRELRMVGSSEDRAELYSPTDIASLIRGEFAALKSSLSH